MKTLYESILSDIDTTLNNSDAAMADMCKIHWSYRKYSEKVLKNVPGGIGGVMKKHFPKKLVPIESHYFNASIKKGAELKFGSRKHNQPNIDYIVALILNTQFPEPIDSYNFYLNAGDKIIDDAITESLNKYMTDESRAFRTDQHDYPVLSAHAWVRSNAMEISVYYHQNDIKYESALLCKIFLKNN